MIDYNGKSFLLRYISCDTLIPNRNKTLKTKILIFLFFIYDFYSNKIKFFNFFFHNYD